MSEVRFRVHGVPAPQGSHKAFMPRGARFPIVTDDCARTRPWRAIVALTAAQHRPAELMSGALALTARFYLPRPKSLPRRVEYPARKPDLSKLVRALEDALTGIIWHDDAQVVLTLATKHYGEPGCDVTVQPISAFDSPTSG